MTRQGYERLKGSLARVRSDIKAGARIGTHAMMASCGGIAGGFIEAKMPTIPNTTLKTNAVLGTAGIVGAVTGLFSEYSDHIGSAASGLLAYALGKESEAYFS